MNRALIYLWIALLKRGALRFLRKLRHPSSAIGFAAVLFCFGLLLHYRHAEWLRHAVRRETLLGGALLMLGGSLFKGFLQRGLVFELPDVDFLFTGPFTRKQIVFYRMLPGYGYSLLQALAFVAVLWPHLKHPLLMGLCLALFQIVCFHVAAGAAIFGGTLSGQAHDRVRWMIVASYAVITLLYFRSAWDLKPVPAFATAPLAQLIFYPAVNLPEIAASSWVAQWSARLVNGNGLTGPALSPEILYAGVCTAAALASLWLLFRVKGDLFETSLATTIRVAKRRVRQQQGMGASRHEGGHSAALPPLAWFGGVRAIIWKNLIVARRSHREMLMAAAYTLVYTGFLLTLRWVLSHFSREGGDLGETQMKDFNLGLVGMMAFLAFLLQRSFPFDFRRDGHHLVAYRTLPVSGFGLALAELAVPVGCCLLFQAVGVLPLMIFGRFQWYLILCILLGFPAVALGLNGVWNAHYLLAATKRAGGKAESASPVTLLMVVALSFLIFYPAGWLAIEVGRHSFFKYSEAVAMATWLIAQYAVDFLLLLLLTVLFHRFEVARDAS